MKNPVLSQVKVFDKEGNVYDQRIRITSDLLANLKSCFESEIVFELPRKKEYIFTSGYEVFMKRLSAGEKVIYLNHTQTRFINLFLKLPLKDKNTYLVIKD